MAVMCAAVAADALTGPAGLASQGHEHVLLQVSNCAQGLIDEW
jgi:hypothetical protein